MLPEPKRRKTDPPSSRGTVSLPATKEIVQVVGAQASGVNFRIQQAKNFAVAQAQQDGCSGNYKIFDSPFGNFLVPTVPSRAELSG